MLSEFILDKVNKVIRCTFYPRANSTPRYASDIIKVRSGIITTNLSIFFYPTTIIDYTNIDVVNKELGLSSPPAATDTLIVSNCYIVNSMPTDIVEYNIPIRAQINRFYPDLDLTNLDNWNVQIFAFDNTLSINRITFSKGIAQHLKTPAIGETPAVYYEKEPYFKMIIPQNYINPGNIIISVTNSSGNILWTWHIWITDYDPNDIIQNGSTYSSQPPINSTLTPWIDKNAGHYKYIKYDSDNPDNKVHRYDIGATEDYSYHMDRNIGASSATHQGQGGLGGRGWLVYQYGRLAPIFGQQARYADGSTYVSEKYDTGLLGAVSRTEAVSKPGVIFHNQNSVNWCSESDITTGKVWNDEFITGNTSTTNPIYGKSIFDPSPLGWMLPPMGEYWVSSGWDAYYTSSTNVQTYVSSSGNTYYSTNVINANTGIANIVMLDFSHIWTNTDVPASETVSSTSMAAGVRFENYTTNNKLIINKPALHDKNTPHCLGAGIRPISQFKRTDPI